MLYTTFHVNILNALRLKSMFNIIRNEGISNIIHSKATHLKYVTISAVLSILRCASTRL